MVVLPPHGVLDGHVQPLEVVAVPLEVGNERSRRAVERYVDAHGGRYEGVVRNATVRPDGRVADYHRFTITKAQYHAATDD